MDRKPKLWNCTPGKYKMKCVYCKRWISRKDLRLSAQHGGKICKDRGPCETFRKNQKALEEENPFLMNSEERITASDLIEAIEREIEGEP